MACRMWNYARPPSKGRSPQRPTGINVFFFLFRLHSELHDGCVFLVLAPSRAMTPPSSVREVRASEVSDPNVTTETGVTMAR